jgi:hypothetical protein
MSPPRSLVSGLRPVSGAPDGQLQPERGGAGVVVGCRRLAWKPRRPSLPRANPGSGAPTRLRPRVTFGAPREPDGRRPSVSGGSSEHAVGRCSGGTRRSPGEGPWSQDGLNLVAEWSERPFLALPDGLRDALRGGAPSGCAGGVVGQKRSNDAVPGDSCLHAPGPPAIVAAYVMRGGAVWQLVAHNPNPLVNAVRPLLVVSAVNRCKTTL